MTDPKIDPKTDWVTPLKKALARWDVSLSQERTEFFQVYLNELMLWNEKFNLTALREPRHIALGHFADSIAPMTLDVVFGSRGARAIDIGSGAGFPGLPLKIVNPDWRLSLVESVGKKCDFLRAVIGSMEMHRVDVHYKRCEELGHDKDHRESYDLTFARALSSLSTLIEYGLPFLKVGGHLVAHRGRTAAEEASRVNTALQQLGGEIKSITHYEVAELGGPRALIVVKKVRSTTKHYPRRTGVAAKRPL